LDPNENTLINAEEEHMNGPNKAANRIKRKAEVFGSVIGEQTEEMQDYSFNAHLMAKR
jgi:hypothetical protein